MGTILDCILLRIQSTLRLQIWVSLEKGSVDSYPSRGAKPPSVLVQDIVAAPRFLSLYPTYLLSLLDAPKSFQSALSVAPSYAFRVHFITELSAALKDRTNLRKYPEYPPLSWLSSLSRRSTLIILRYRTKFGKHRELSSFLRFRSMSSFAVFRSVSLFLASSICTA